MPRRPPERKPFLSLVILALSLWLLLLGFSFTDLTRPTRAYQLLAFLAAFAVFCVAVGVVWRLGHEASRRTVWFILLVGVFLRLSLAPMRPVTTSDIYRYLWEGRLINRGHNPYSERPNSPHLAPLHDWVWERLQFKSVPAAYPPAAQYAFALADRFPADRILTLKLLLAALDIGTMFLLYGLLIRLGRPRAWILLYAWHPLVVGEVVARGHLDSIGIYFLALAMWLFVRDPARHQFLSGAALAASMLSKGYALFLLPYFALAARPRPLWWGLGVALTAVLLYLPFASAGWELLRGIGLYGTRWEGYGSVFQVVKYVAGFAAADPSRIARVVCAALFAAWLIVLGRKTIHDPSPSRLFDSSFLALAGFFLLSPVLYPWYLAWTVPFLCLRPRPAWLLFTGTVFLFYAHGFAPPHVEIWCVKVLEYVPPLLFALYVECKRRRAASCRRAADRPTVGARP